MTELKWIRDAWDAMAIVRSGKTHRKVNITFRKCSVLLKIEYGKHERAVHSAFGPFDVTDMLPAVDRCLLCVLYGCSDNATSADLLLVVPLQVTAVLPA